MKRILYLTTMLAATGFLFSCSKLNEPKIFSDDDAFIAFSAYTYNVPEDAGTFEIPVTLSSMSGLTATVAFSTTDSLAKKGIDFEIIGDGTLSFNKDKRTDTIRFKIHKDSLYTGDKFFFVSLEPASNSGVNKGYNSIIAVIINDLDHPLTAILGDYSASNDSDSWTLTLKKDANDDHKVWFYDICGLGSWVGDDMMYYGVVDDNMSTITVPLGQTAEYKYSGSIDMYLYGLDLDDEVYEEGNVVFTFSADKKTMTADNGFIVYVGDLGYAAYAYPTITCVKK